RDVRGRPPPPARSRRRVRARDRRRSAPHRRRVSARWALGGRRTAVARVMSLPRIVVVTSVLAITGSARAAVSRTPGPAGSLVIVDESHAVPVVEVIVAARTGSSRDPRGAEGLTNLAAETARRGAAGRSRADLDEAFDALGA